MPRSPDRTRPRSRAVIVVSQVGGADEMQHRQLAWAGSALEDGEVVVVAQHSSQDVCGVCGGDVEVENGTEPDQVDEDRLPVASVAAVTGVLRHVGVYDETVGRRIAEALGLIGLHFTEDLPTAR
jgi:hypothetical protein